ncbi:MAG TPA: DUF1761 domain-containing protein [Cyclobacteriaceae bacterium]
MMESMQINFVAVLVATVANFFVGYAWYTPLFGKAWAKENGFDRSVKPAGGAFAKGLIMNIIGNLFMAYVFASNSMAWSFVPGIGEMSLPLQVFNAVFFTWLGFYLPVDLNTVAWEQKSWTLFAINTGYHFVTLLVAGLILLLWN